MANEKIGIRSPETQNNLGPEAKQAQERLRQTHEREVARHEQGERNSPETVAERTHEAKERAASIETTPEKTVHEKAPTSPERPLSKKRRAQAFDTVMDDVRPHMSPASHAFSKVIHNRAVEKTSEVAGATTLYRETMLYHQLPWHVENRIRCQAANRQ